MSQDSYVKSLLAGSDARSSKKTRIKTIRVARCRGALRLRKAIDRLFAGIKLQSEDCNCVVATKLDDGPGRSSSTTSERSCSRVEDDFVDWYSEEVRDAVIVRRRGDRPAIGCPCGSTLQVERIGHNPCVGAIGQHHVQERLPVLPDRERDIPAIGGRLPDGQKFSLLDHSTTPFQLRSQVSRYSRWCWSKKHTEDNLDPVVGRTQCRSSARFEWAPRPQWVNQ